MKNKRVKNKIIISLVAVVLVAVFAVLFFVPAFMSEKSNNFNYSNATVANELAYNQYEKRLGEDVAFLYDTELSVLGVACAFISVPHLKKLKKLNENH